MMSDSQHAREIKSTLDNLIHSAASAHLNVLETLYHRDMTVYMLGPDYTLHRMDKPDFIAHLNKSIAANGAPDTWAEYHVVEADAERGHVIISRKVNLAGTEKVITLSIDFVFEDDRWQISREVIFAA